MNSKPGFASQTRPSATSGTAGGDSILSYPQRTVKKTKTKDDRRADGGPGQGWARREPECKWFLQARCFVSQDREREAIVVARLGVADFRLGCLKLGLAQFDD